MKSGAGDPRRMATATIELDGPYALGPTLFSGQSFRWRGDGDNFLGYAAGRPVRLSRKNGQITAEGRPGDADREQIAAYLRARDPMAEIYRAIGKDPAIAQAVGRWRGLHLLSQDPWETTACFIASSASNIPRITRNVEALCARFGKRVEAPWGQGRLFPSPSAIARASIAELRACGVGYRAAYLKGAARSVSGGAVDLDALRREPTERARGQLVEALDGVGPKVADCILLFALGKDDAFPVDRWIQRRVAELYHGGEVMPPGKVAQWGRDRWGRWAGYAQQYLFHDGRTRTSSAGGR